MGVKAGRLTDHLGSRITCDHETFTAMRVDTDSRGMVRVFDGQTFHYFTPRTIVTVN